MAEPAPLPEPHTWDVDGVRVTASAETGRFRRRPHLVVTLEAPGLTSRFRGDDLVRLIDGEARQIDSDSEPLAFLVAGGGPAIGAAIDPVRTQTPSDAIALVVTPDVGWAVHTFSAADVEQLRWWLRGSRH